MTHEEPLKPVRIAHPTSHSRMVALEPLCQIGAFADGQRDFSTVNSLKLDSKCEIAAHLRNINDFRRRFLRANLDHLVRQRRGRHAYDPNAERSSLDRELRARSVRSLSAMRMNADKGSGNYASSNVCAASGSPHRTPEGDRKADRLEGVPNSSPTTIAERECHRASGLSEG